MRTCRPVGPERLLADCRNAAHFGPLARNTFCGTMLSTFAAAHRDCDSIGLRAKPAPSVQRHVQTITGRELKNHLLSFIAAESASLAPGERLPGSSEPLESSLGKLKSFEGDFDKSGFTGFLPAVGAIVGRLTPETISQALVSVPGKNVQHWITQHLGQPFLSKRRLALQN